MEVVAALVFGAGHKRQDKQRENDEQLPHLSRRQAAVIQAVLCA